MFNSEYLDQKFKEFISMDCDRCSFITKFLEDRGVDVTIIRVDDKKHIYVNFPKNQYNGMFRIKTIIAHYDRVTDTPGANDNSMAVFTLMDWAAVLAAYSEKFKYQHNIRLIFTDGEELSSEGVTSQGAYNLAKHFQRIPDEDIFVFDCMGRGNIPVLCDNGLPSRAGDKFIRQYAELDSRAEKILQQSSSSWIRLPANYSDNAGFLACGIPAIAFTMLPSTEAENYLYFTMKYGKKTDRIKESEEFKEDFKKYYPPTWLMLHSRSDDFDHLTAESTDIFLKILGNISSLRTLK